MNKAIWVKCNAMNSGVFDWSLVYIFPCLFSLPTPLKYIIFMFNYFFQSSMLLQMLSHLHYSLPSHQHPSFSLLPLSHHLTILFTSNPPITPPQSTPITNTPPFYTSFPTKELNLFSSPSNLLILPSPLLNWPLKYTSSLDWRENWSNIWTKLKMGKIKM